MRRRRPSSARSARPPPESTVPIARKRSPGDGGYPWPMKDGRSVARQAGLLIVVFIATFALLIGGRALLGRAASDGIAHSAAPVLGGPIFSPAATAPPSAALSGSADVTVVLTGAGDIADCATGGAAKTSDLLLRETGFFFTAGDNAYENGSIQNFNH